MSSGLTKRSVTFLSFGVLLWFGCGGKAALHADDDASVGGQSGRGGQSGWGGQGISGQPSIDTHKSECEALCSKATAAGCSAGEAPCVMTCATVTAFPNCQGAIQSWLDCAKAAAVVCDASGTPGFPACDTLLALAGACAIATPAAPPVAESCSGYCNEIETAGCTLSTPLGDCEQACGLAGTALSSCQESYLAWLNCARKSGTACQPDGQPNSSVCPLEQLTWLGCVTTLLGTTTPTTLGSAGAPGWPTGIVPTL